MKAVLGLMSQLCGICQLKKKNGIFRITSGLGWKPSLARCISMEAPTKMLIFGNKMASGYGEEPGLHISVV